MKKSDAQKRVAIARDVIKQLKSELIGACHLYFYGKIYDILSAENNPLADVRALIRKAKIKKNLCDVCAKGALLIAHILRFDKMNVSEVQRAERLIYSYSSIPYFTNEQFNLIETLYESNGYKLGPASPWRKFYDRIDDLRNEDRLIAIMKEIIRRRGSILT